MHKTSPIIIWEKWQDPILNNIIDHNESVENNLTDTENFEPYESDSSFNTDNKAIFKYPIVITPMGMLPYSEKTTCDKVFNFWIGHTNFTITQTISNIIEYIDGVETLDVFTRYRFRIGIGKAFKDSIVMTNINSKIYEHIND